MSVVIDPVGCKTIEERLYRYDAKGGLVPDEMVKPADKLRDELVRRLSADAQAMSSMLAKFRDGAMADVDEFVELVASDYAVSLGGKKGNVTLDTYDGLFRIQVQVSDQQHFGEELQAAKALVDECLTDWGSRSPPELAAVVRNAFDVRKEGQVNRGALFGLLRLDIADERWKRGMQAIRDSIRVDGSKEYIRFYSRPNAKAKWVQISLYAATA